MESSEGQIEQRAPHKYSRTSTRTESQINYAFMSLQYVVHTHTHPAHICGGATLQQWPVQQQQRQWTSDGSVDGADVLPGTFDRKQ